MNKIKLILFDLDDTLIHFEDYWKPSLLATFRLFEYTKDLSSYQLLERLLEHNVKYQKMYHNKEITLRQFRNFRFIDTLASFERRIDECTAEDFNLLHKNTSRKFMKLNPSLVHLLSELNQSYELGIVTNGISNWQKDKIEATGLDIIFKPESLIISEDVGYEKPSSEIYKKALSVFGIPAEETLFVGDSWENDVVGPGKTGINSVWLNNKKQIVQPFSKLKGVISKIDEIKRYL